MSDYHQYIYDRGARKIIGDFEAAYKNCEDTWPSQHDVHLLKYQSVFHRLRCLGPEARVADIGCGYGDFVAFLRRSGIDACGYEISPTAVAKGQERFGLDSHLAAADLLSGIPSADESFDVIVLFGVFWFLLDGIDAAMDEVKRLLKPGGILVASIGMVADPIGKETLGSYDDFIGHLRKHFAVTETALHADSSDLRRGLPYSQCATDLVAYCEKRP